MHFGKIGRHGDPFKRSQENKGSQKLRAEILIRAEGVSPLRELLSDFFLLLAPES